MKPLTRPLVLFTFFVCVFHSLSAQDLASAYKPKNQTERLVIARIRSLPEVKDFFNYVKKDKPDFIINPPDKSNNCYAMQIGIDYGDSFRTDFWLMIDPKTFQVYYDDFAAFGDHTTITLQQWRYWRKRPEFNKSHRWVKGKLVLVKDEKKGI